MSYTSNAKENQAGKGEWVITAILRETSFEMIVAQTALALMLAAEFFNTRQHGNSVSEKPLRRDRGMDQEGAP
eukprot:s1097_g2.t1